jgi:hypothetical protein
MCQANAKPAFGYRAGLHRDGKSSASHVGVNAMGAPNSCGLGIVTATGVCERDAPETVVSVLSKNYLNPVAGT